MHGFGVGNDGVKILGGNDNDDTSHPLYDSDAEVLSNMPTEGSNRLLAKKDDVFNYWMLYNPESGAKLRLSFSEKKETPTRSSIPELIDIKVTDYCEMGCKFCYMGSTKKGRHASWKYLSGLAQLLGQSKVAECALGGGEPLSHPDIFNFISCLRSAGVKAVNFTTRQLDWLSDPQSVQKLLGENGCFAYSVDDEKGLDRLHKAITENGYTIRHPSGYSRDEKAIRATAQYVMGVLPEDKFKQLLEKAKELEISLTFLGFKHTGRGVHFKPHDYSNWIQILKDSGYWHARIDTALAKEFEKELLEADVSATTFHTDEGRFSCWIDAVNQKIGVSSYTDLDKMKPLDKIPDTLNQYADNFDPDAAKKYLSTKFMSLTSLPLL